MSLVSPIRMFIARRWQMDLALTNPGYDWYVDSVNGNDANTGRSAAQAFQTIAGLEAAGIGTGDRIGLARGSTWNEVFNIVTLGITGLTVQAYGSGNRPIFDCRDTIANASFSKTGGQTNVYEKSVTFTASVTDAQILVWEDGTVLTLVADVATCDSTAGSYYIGSHTTSPQTLYVHASDSSDVTVNGKTYKYNPRIAGVYAQLIDNTTVKGVHAIGNLAGAGSIVVGDFGLIDDCVMEMGGKHSCLAGTGSTVKDSTFRNASIQVPASNSLLVINAGTPNGEGATITGCTFEVTQQAPGYLLIKPILAHNNVSGDFGTINISNCTLDSLDSASILTNHTTTLNVTDCTYTNCRLGFASNTLCPNVNFIRPVWTSNVANQRIVSNTTAAALNVSGLVATIAGAAADASNGYIYNNADATISVIDSTIDISGVTGGTQIVVYNSHASAEFTLTGNTYTGTWTGTNYNYFGTPASGAWSITSDDNSFQTFRIYYDSVVYSAIADWRAATSQDINSTVG